VLGADFNGSATINGLLQSSYPPQSGSKVIENLLQGYIRGDIRVDAVGAEWLKASGYVTGTENVTLTAYAASGSVLGTPSSTGGPNIVGYGTPNIPLSVSATNTNIAYVSMGALKPASNVRVKTSQ